MMMMTQCGEEGMMFWKACQQYFKLSRRLKIQLSFEENFKLTFHSRQINVFVLSDFGVVNFAHFI